MRAYTQHGYFTINPHSDASKCYQTVFESKIFLKNCLRNLVEGSCFLYLLGLGYSPECMLSWLLMVISGVKFCDSHVIRCFIHSVCEHAWWVIAELLDLYALQQFQIMENSRHFYLSGFLTEIPFLSWWYTWNQIRLKCIFQLDNDPIVLLLYRVEALEIIHLRALETIFLAQKRKSVCGGVEHLFGHKRNSG